MSSVCPESPGHAENGAIGKSATSIVQDSQLAKLYDIPFAVCIGASIVLQQENKILISYYN